MQFEDTLDQYGGIIMFGGLAILVAIGGGAYYLPLDDAMKINVWGVCGLAFLVLSLIMIVWFVAVMVVGVGRGFREGVKQVQDIRRNQAEQFARLTPVQREHYAALRAEDERVRAMKPEEREAYYAERSRSPAATGPLT